jgi:hypothetical protein
VHIVERAIDDAVVGQHVLDAKRRKEPSQLDAGAAGLLPSVVRIEDVLG